MERQALALIVQALDGSGLEKTVAASTGGARAGERPGDLNTLWELEQGYGLLTHPRSRATSFDETLKSL